MMWGLFIEDRQLFFEYVFLVFAFYQSYNKKIYIIIEHVLYISVIIYV
jgi:hypothetical protein